MGFKAILAAVAAAAVGVGFMLPAPHAAFHARPSQMALLDVAR